MLSGRSGSVVAIPGTDEFLILDGGDVLRTEMSAGRAISLADARAITDAVGRPVAMNALASIAVDRDGARAFVAMDGIGLVPLDLATGGIGRPLGPPPKQGFQAGADPVLRTAAGLFVIGRHEIGRVEGDGIRWLFDVAALDPVRGWAFIDHALADPLDPHVLWLALATGPCRFDTRTGKFDLHVPPDGEGAAPGSTGLWLHAGKLWGFREPVPGQDTGGILARDVAGGSWRRVSGLSGADAHARVVGVAHDGRLVIVGYSGGAWHVDPRTLVATPFAPGEPTPPQETWAIADDGTTLHAISHVGHDRLCWSGPQGSGCVPFDSILRKSISVRGMILDPRDPNILLLATWRGLVRLDKRSLTSVVVGEGCYADLERVGNHHVWANGVGTSGDGGSTLLFDLEVGLGQRVMTTDPSWPDPSDPRRAWILTKQGFQLTDIATRRVLRSVAANGIPLRSRFRVTQAAGRSTAWVGCCGGLAEVDLGENGK